MCEWCVCDLTHCTYVNKSVRAKWLCKGLCVCACLVEYTVIGEMIVCKVGRILSSSASKHTQQDTLGDMDALYTHMLMHMNRYSITL